MVKQTLKRRKPGFNESYHGFRSFGQLLEEAQARKLLLLEHDEKSGGYIIKHVTDYGSAGPFQVHFQAEQLQHVLQHHDAAAAVADGEEKAAGAGAVHQRTEERRVGAGWVSPSRSRWSLYH